MANYTAEQMRQYQNQRRKALRAELLTLLGGKCVRCDVTTDLQFDHVDPATKLFEIASGLDKPREVLLAEVTKCQLLCEPHHKEKTASEPDNRQITYLKGEDHRWAKLTEAQAREILASDLPASQLARKFGVGRTTVQAVRSGRSWSHLAGVEQKEAQVPVKHPSIDTGGSSPSSGTQTDEHYPQGDI